MHNIVAQYQADGFNIKEHSFTLPLDYRSTNDSSIDVFARELSTNEELPWLIYFQGGPGFGALKPSANGWLKAAAHRFQILLLDQRGTGRSSPIHASTLTHLSAAETAAYLKLFRADNIVRDAEQIRTKLGISKWSSLGQSFGGFCTLTYLSFFPKSLERCFVTGGIAAIYDHVDDIYRQCYREVISKTEQFFQKYPRAFELCQEIANYLHQHKVFFTNGQRFTVEQFQALGIELGRGRGKESLYSMIEDAFTANTEGQRCLNDAFIHRVYCAQSFNSHPIYAILHESIYSEGEASRWSANRIRQEFPELNWQPGKKLMFTGEMIFPSMFEDFPALTPLKKAAHLLAQDSKMAPLYRRSQLANNKVPLYCAVYLHDMYVPAELSRKTLAHMSHVHPWYTSKYEHDGLSQDGEYIFNYLADMAGI